MPILRRCPICASAAHDPIKTLPSPDRPLSVVLCRDCRLVYVNPMYTEAEKTENTPEVARLHRSRSFARLPGEIQRHAGPRVSRCLDAIEPHLRPGNRVLEVGFGDGLILAWLKARGMNPTGVEMDDVSARQVGEQLGVPVRIGAFEEVEFPASERFDAVIMVHLIEHFYDPVAALRKVHRLLKPGGMIFLETPNILRPKVGPRRLYSLAHNYHFSPRSLALGLHEAGFACQELREFRRDSFQIVARSRSARHRTLPPRPDDASEVLRAVRGHAWRYTASLQFLWRKTPWGRRWMYGLHRHLHGESLRAWLLDGPVVPARAAG